MRLTGLVVGLVSSVALADGTLGVPPSSQQRNLQSTPDAGSVHPWVDSIQLNTRGIPARSVLLYVSAVDVPGVVSLRFVPSGPVVSTFVGQPGWHEWEFPTPVVYGYFVVESSSAVVTIQLQCFAERHDFPSQQQAKGFLFFRGCPTTGVLRLAGVVPNGCPAPDNDPVAGNPYVETRLLPPGTEQQRLRFFTGEFWQLRNPLGTRGTMYADAVRLIDFNGQAHVRDSRGHLTTAATGPTDGGMSDPFILEFESDGGNLWAAYSHPPNNCHPVARAGLDWEESRWLGGPAGSDLVFRLHPEATWPRHLDLDGDGYRGASFEWSLNSDSTWNDCDDTNALRHPNRTEVCNGIDDDCDAIVDGANVALVRCERTAGLCATARHQSSDCQGGQWLSCEAAGRYSSLVVPEERVCNGVDEDCDGIVDDHLPPVSCPLTQGVCAGSSPNACVAGFWSACEYGPHYEVNERTCDGLDNDCDGVADAADVQPAPCELQRGVCLGAKKPASACGVNGWEACTAAQYGADFELPESRCDGLDNDCDGLTDAEDSDLASVLCSNQAGVCAGSRHVPAECDVATWRACATDRLPNTWQANESRCDGLDNDCDGLTDEGCKAAPMVVPPKPQGCGCSTSGAAELLLILMAECPRRESNPHAIAGTAF